MRYGLQKRQRKRQKRQRRYALSVSSFDRNSAYLCARCRNTDHNQSFESATAEMTRALGEVEGVEKGAAYTKIEIQLREELLEVKNLVSSLQKEQDKLVEAAVTAYFNTYGLKIEDLKIQAVAHA